MIISMMGRLKHLFLLSSCLLVSWTTSAAEAAALGTEGTQDKVVPPHVDKSNVSLSKRTSMNRSDVIVVFLDTTGYDQYQCDVVYQRMDLVNESQIPEWQERVKQWHNAGRIVHGCLNPLTQLDKVFEYVMNDPGLQAAVCLDFNYNPIVTGWMEGRRYKGKPVHLYCGNHPTFRAWLREQTFMIAETGADGYHVDDACGNLFAYNFGGCFCDYCMEGFRQYLKHKYTAAELKTFGIEDIASFNYRNMVLRYADDLTSFRRAKSRGEIPLIDDFQKFIFQSDVELFKSLREMGSRIRGKYMPMGWDNVQLQGSRGPYYDNLDIFYAEMEYDQFYLDAPNEQQDFDRARQVEQAIMPAAVVPHKFVDAVDKWYAPIPSPWSWSKIKELNLSGLLRQWVAFTYANGGFMRYPKKGWCFGETSRWFYPKQEDYEPLYAFIRNNPTLFDDYEAVQQVGVLYTHHPVGIGSAPFRPLRYVCGQLVENNIPFGIAVAGDAWLSNRLQKDAIDKYELMLIPESLRIEQTQKRIVDEWKAQQGNKVVSVKESDNVGQLLKGRVEPLVSVESNSDIWLFPRKIPARKEAPIVCHVYNHHYDDKTNQMTAQRNVTIRLSDRLLNGKPARRVMYHTFEGLPIELPFKTGEAGITVTIPSIELWGILQVEV